MYPPLGRMEPVISVEGEPDNLPELTADPPFRLKPSSDVINSPSGPARLLGSRNPGSPEITPGPVIQLDESGLETLEIPPSVSEYSRLKRAFPKIAGFRAIWFPVVKEVLPQSMLFWRLTEDGENSFPSKYKAPPAPLAEFPYNVRFEAEKFEKKT